MADKSPPTREEFDALQDRLRRSHIAILDCLIPLYGGLIALRKSMPVIGGIPEFKQYEDELSVSIRKLFDITYEGVER